MLTEPKRLKTRPLLMSQCKIRSLESFVKKTLSLINYLGKWLELPKDLEV
jgi:hypothetical protein